MKINILSIIFISFGISLFSCKSNPKADKVVETIDDATEKVGKAVDNTVDKVKEQLDENFITKTLDDNAEELEWLRAGSKMGTDPELIAIAKRMIPDHEKLEENIRIYATKNNIKLDRDPSDGVKINSKTGTEWDEEWADKIRDMHRDMVDRFKRVQSKAEDPELKEFATNSLPVLRDHLNMTEKLEARLSKTINK